MLRRRDLRAGKKGGTGIGLTRRGKGSKVMALVDGHGLPIAIYACAADRHESHLVVQLLFDFMFLDELPDRAIGDKGYDDDKLDAELDEYGIDMIAPNKKNRRFSKARPIPGCSSWLGQWRNTISRHFAESHRFFFISVLIEKLMAYWGAMAIKQSYFLPALTCNELESRMGSGYDDHMEKQEISTPEFLKIGTTLINVRYYKEAEA